MSSARLPRVGTTKPIITKGSSVSSRAGRGIMRRRWRAAATAPAIPRPPPCVSLLGPGVKEKRVPRGDEAGGVAQRQSRGLISPSGRMESPRTSRCYAADFRGDFHSTVGWRWMSCRPRWGPVWGRAATPTATPARGSCCSRASFSHRLVSLPRPRVGIRCPDSPCSGTWDHGDPSRGVRGPHGT